MRCVAGTWQLAHTYVCNFFLFARIQVLTFCCELLPLCRFKQKPPWPVLSMVTSFGILVIALLVAHIIHATVSRIHKVEEDCDKMKQLKKKAEAADVAKSQVNTSSSVDKFPQHIKLSMTERRVVI